MATTQLTLPELQRYARHLTLPGFGIAGQERLAASRVLVIGAGGLGSPAALYLAAAGVGTIGLVDDDLVDVSNLQRQIVHDTASIGRSKTGSARARLADLNPDVEVVEHNFRLTGDNAVELVGDYHIVIDGSDNFPTRYLVNDACVLAGVPLVYGSIFRFEGQLSVFAAPGGPCYRCLFAEPPAPELVPSCVDAGVLGVLPGIIGSMQALEAIKWLTGLGEPAVGRLLMFDALTLKLREIALRRDPGCAVCGDNPSITAPIDYEEFCGVKTGPVETIDAMKLKAALNGEVPPVLIDVREPWEFELAHIPGSVSIPGHQLPARLSELGADNDLVVVCLQGTRSESAAALLARSGFGRVRVLDGGLEAWGREVDPAMPRY